MAKRKLKTNEAPAMVSPAGGNTFVPSTKLKDFSEDQFQTFEDVPIFYEFDDGDISFTADELAKVVEVNNQRYQEGEYSALIVGHTTNSEDEKPVIGFIDQLKMGLRNGISTIFARFRVYLDKAAAIRDYPRRSIEIWEDSLQMPAVALLGGTQARLDLGVFYSKSNEQKLQFSKNKITVSGLNIFSTGVKMAVSDELRQAILEVLGETKEIAFVQDLMNKTETTDEDAEVETNEVEDSSDEKLDEPVTNDADQEDVAVSDEDQEDKKDDYQKQNAELLIKCQKLEREKAFMQLANDHGVVLNLQEELSDTESYSDEQFQKYCARLVKNYQKAPVGKKIDSSKLNSTGELSSAEIEEIKAYAIKNCRGNFAEALKTFKK